METKKHQVTENKLLSARKEALSAAEQLSLRPLGKLWGMDVFTWYNPPVEELAATVTTFPFPVFWLGNAKLIAEMAQVDPVSMRSLAWCGQYDNSQIILPADVLANMPLVSATETLEDALELIYAVGVVRHVLLFTVSGNEWKTNLANFEEFVRQNGKK